MAVKSNKDTVITKRFKAALTHIIKVRAASQTEIAKELGVGTGSLSNFLKSGASAATMEEVANKLGYDLLDMLTIGRSILEGAETALEAPQTTKAPPALAPERELELLRKIEEKDAKREELSAKVIEKDEKIERLEARLAALEIAIASKQRTAEDGVSLSTVANGVSSRTAITDKKD